MSCRRRKLKGIDDVPSAKNGSRSKNAAPKDAIESNFVSADAVGDRNVVEWWRSQRRENGADDFVGQRGAVDSASRATNIHYEDELYNEHMRHNILPSSRSSQVTDTWEHNESGMNLRPYNNPHHDFLTNPQNGMVLDPSMLPIESEKEKPISENPSLGIFMTRGRSLDSNDGIEFFQPEIVPATGDLEQFWKLKPPKLNLSSPNEANDTTGTTFVSEEGEEVSLASFEEQMDESYDKERRKGTSSKLRKKLSLSQFMAKKSKAPPKRASPTEFSDHLSDVPSYVDSVTRERYLLACQMLKMSIIRKESALISVEKEYILNLLEDFDNHSVDGSELSIDHISSIERAVQQLESDSLLEVPQDDANVDVPSPATAARAQRPHKEGGVVRAVNSMPPGSDKNPHTATRSPKKILDQVVSSACNPETLPQLLGNNSDQYSEDDFGMPSHRDGGRLMRFDGWAVQNLLEYPFAILDTHGYHTKPKVFTPGVMEALRSFMPMKVMDHNFWLRYSLSRDGRSFTKLLASIRASTFTMIGVETDRGEVFGSFTATPWMIGSKWYGSRKSFLWRLKNTRYTTARHLKNPHYEREIEVYPCTEDDDLIQYCTAKTIAIGGGEWQYNACPYRDGGQGIGLVIDGDLVGGETSSCATFANPKLARYASSSNEFLISNLEVWSMTPCSTVEDATKVEMREFFINGY